MNDYYDILGVDKGLIEIELLPCWAIKVLVWFREKYFMLWENIKLRTQRPIIPPNWRVVVKVPVISPILSLGDEFWIAAVTTDNWGPKPRPNINKAKRSRIKLGFSVFIKITTNKQPRSKPPPPNKGNILYLPERAINLPETVVEQMIPKGRDIRKQPE